MRATQLNRLFATGLVIALVAVACGADSDSRSAEDPTPTVEDVAPTATTVPEPTPTVPQPTATPDLSDLVPLDSETEGSIVARLSRLFNWNTDFSKKTIDMREISVLLSRDQISPIDEPTFAPVSNPPDYMEAREPVISVEVNGEARAYPLAMLMWHEIVNDTLGGVPITVTFCPLCNSAVVFERTVDGDVLTFGTTGALRNSDLVMWDRQTESWWQQFTGKAIAGDYAGQLKELGMIPSAVVAWETFVETHPDGEVLERIFNDAGFPIRRYDLPPYAGYDSVDNTNPFAFDGPVDGRLPAAARVLSMEFDGMSVAYPFSFLESNPVLNDSVGDVEFVAFFDDETLSAFVDEIEDPQVSGSVTAFNRRLGGELLEFELVDGRVRDVNTGSEWTVGGVATSGELAGERLDPVLHREDFWFAWSVFKPETELRGVE